MREIVSVATVPRLVTGRIRTLEEADKFPRDYVADLDVVRKAREGRADEAQPCIGCNQGCWGRHEHDGRFGYTVTSQRRSAKLNIGDIAYWLDQEFYRPCVDVRLTL
ncbi:MAG: hypothetical protein ACSLE1_12385 [Sphingobium sp.]